MFIAIKYVQRAHFVSLLGGILLCMTDRRSGPPLFDLMRERGNQPDPNKPGSPIAPKPQPKQQSQSPSQSSQSTSAQPHQPRSNAAPLSQGQSSATTKQTAWDTSGGVSRAERSAAAMLDDEVQSDTRIRISSPVFYSTIAIVLIVIVGAFSGGYKYGVQQGKKEMGQFVVDQPVVRPIQPEFNDPIETPKAQPTTNPSQNTQPQSNPTKSASTPTGAGVLGPSGFLKKDPRTIGMNYLVLATLDTEQATDAISFLYSNGVTVIGVPQLDSRKSNANNPSRYTLYSLGLAIPGNRWSAMSSDRSQHQQLIANLGARWQREHRGGSDFSQTNWEKFE